MSKPNIIPIFIHRNVGHKQHAQPGFIEHIRAHADVTLAEALIEAGAIRLRLIFLTAGAAMFGAFVIIFWTRSFQAWPGVLSLVFLLPPCFPC